MKWGCRQLRSAVWSFGWPSALLAFLVLAPAAQAQEPTLRSAVDTTIIYVGDRVRLRVVVDHAVDQAVTWSDSISVAPFELVELRIGESDPIDGGLRSRAEYLLTSFELGELDIPSFGVTVASESGSSTTLDTDPFRIGVLSVGVDESGELRDIKGPLSLPRQWWQWGILLLAGFLLLLVLRYLLGRRKKRPVAAPTVPPPPLRPFHEVALEKLDALEASTLLQDGEVKPFHIRLSDILREYIEGQLSVPAMEMATIEVVQGLRGAALGAPLCEAFGDFLSRCDLVKFAKLRPTGESALKLLEVGRSLVDQTSGWTSDEEVQPERVLEDQA
ncbi:MAG: hypothetical protein ACR2QM_20160 [Longimicrobiales bacterium]